MFIALGGAGRNFPLGKLAHRLPEKLLFFGKFKSHYLVRVGPTPTRCPPAFAKASAGSP